MKKTFLALLTAVALTATPAFAQTAAVADPAAVAEVKQLLESMRFREIMAASVERIEQSMPQQMKSVLAARINSQPKLSDAEKKTAIERAEKAIPGAIAAVHNVLADPALIDEMIAEMVPLYARTYSADEIRQLSAFYQTPLGQKMLRTMPQLSAESMKISNRLMMPRIQKMTQQITENFAKP